MTTDALKKEMARSAAFRNRAVKKLKLGRAVEAAALRLLHTVAKRAAERDMVAVSFCEIALNLRCSTKTVQRAAVALEQAELLSRVEGRHKGRSPLFEIGWAAVRPELRGLEMRASQTDTEMDRNSLPEMDSGHCQTNGQNCTPLYIDYKQRPFLRVDPSRADGVGGGGGARRIGSTPTLQDPSRGMNRGSRGSLYCLSFGSGSSLADIEAEGSA